MLLILMILMGSRKYAASSPEGAWPRCHLMLSVQFAPASLPRQLFTVCALVMVVPISSAVKIDRVIYSLFFMMFLTFPDRLRRGKLEHFLCRYCFVVKNSKYYKKLRGVQGFGTRDASIAGTLQRRKKGREP